MMYETKIIEATNANEFELKVKGWKRANPLKEVIDIDYVVVPTSENQYLYTGVISFKEGVCY